MMKLGSGCNVQLLQDQIQPPFELNHALLQRHHPGRRRALPALGVDDLLGVLHDLPVHARERRQNAAADRELKLLLAPTSGRHQLDVALRLDVDDRLRFRWFERLGDVDGVRLVGLDDHLGAGQVLGKQVQEVGAEDGEDEVGAGKGRKLFRCDYDYDVCNTYNTPVDFALIAFSYLDMTSTFCDSPISSASALIACKRKGHRNSFGIQ